ncbi:Rha family transcriptional regulator [Longicatena caecimuris]|uniref:Rha family transcriptional regulator n=1 Tax=Longicatena caecimuris TaxID=1796635 RepID=UPI0018AB51EC|nr:Rha family transcriptional regulator [Longicatena caecimuris]
MEQIINITYDQDHQQPVVSSLQVAEDFGKQHKNVLQTIKNMTAENSALLEMFFETTYVSSQNKELPMILMNRDGFSLLVMGFTGSEALTWKLKYIQAFNAMEEQLIKQVPADPMQALELMFAAEKETRGMVHEVKQDFEEFKQDLPLIGEEPDDIRELVNEIALCALGSTKKLRSPAYKDSSVRAKVYSDIWHELKRKFGVRKYKAIKRKYVEDVKTFLTEEYQCPETLIDEIRKINDGKVNETI